MKRMTALFLILTLCLCLLSGCGRKDTIPTEDVELWVMTELTSKYRMNDQAEQVIEQFRELYPNVTVKLDILPTNDEERAVYMTKLRTQIMAGAGPDVYLMPTYDYVPESTNANSRNKKVELLFPDVEMAMYNGLFCDISRFYDADEALNKEELNTSVMDGGVVDGARYVLPLRYDFGVYLVDRENFEALGGDVSVFEKGADDVMAMALELEDAALAYGAMFGRQEYYLGDFLDIPSGQFLITQEKVAEFLRNYQLANSMFMQSDLHLEYSSGPGGYIYFKNYFASCGLGMCGTSLSGLVSALTTAKVVEEEIEMYPMLAYDGTLNANVEYYGAVGAGCEYPRLAYEFVRLFLSEEMQYETYLNSKKYSQAEYTAWYGWPVRTAGSVAPRFDTFRYQLSHVSHKDAGERKRAEEFEDRNLTLTDADIPAVTWEVDGVIFPITGDSGIDLVSYYGLLIDIDNDYAPTDVGIDALAKEYIEKLKLHLEEG